VSQLRINLIRDFDGHDSSGYDRDGYDEDGEPRIQCSGSCRRWLTRAEAAEALSTDDGHYCADCADDEQDCPGCSGTGEGCADGDHCRRCRGSGSAGSPRSWVAEKDERTDY